jgi:hypothetical protein
MSYGQLKWAYGAFSIDMNRLWRIFQISINMLQIFLSKTQVNRSKPGKNRDRKYSPEFWIRNIQKHFKKRGKAISPVGE